MAGLGSCQVSLHLMQRCKQLGVLLVSLIDMQLHLLLMRLGLPQLHAPPTWARQHAVYSWPVQHMMRAACRQYWLTLKGSHKDEQ